MLEDRLRPRYASRAPSSLYRRDYSPRTGSTLGKPTSPRQRKAKAIVNKYRKNVRYAQLYRLKSLVPAVKDKEEASEVILSFFASLLFVLLEFFHFQGLLVHASFRNRLKQLSLTQHFYTLNSKTKPCVQCT